MIKILFSYNKKVIVFFLIFLICLLLFITVFAETGAHFDSVYLKQQNNFKEYQPMDYYLSNIKQIQTADISNYESSFINKTSALSDKLLNDTEMLNTPEKYLTFYDFNSKEQKDLINKINKNETEELFKKKLNLNFLITYAYIKNPKLNSLKLNWEASLQQYSQTVYLDNILRQYNSFTKTLNTKTGMQMQKEFIAKNFPLPGVLSIKGNIVSTNTAIEFLEYETAVRNLITEIKTAYHDYLFINQSIDIVKENQSLLTSILNAAEAKYSSGKGSFSNIIKAQVEYTKLEDNLITLKEKINIVKANLNTLLNRHPESELGIPENIIDNKLEIPIDTLYTLTENNQQEIKIIKLKIDKMSLMLKMGQRMFFPEATTGASYFEDRSGILSSSGKGMMQTFNPAKTPMMMPQYYWFQKNDAYLEELKTRIKSMEYMLIAKKNMYSFKTKAIYFNLDSAEREINLYLDTLILKADEALRAANAGYQGGKVDFQQVIDSQRSYLNFKLNLYTAINKYRNKLVELEENIGIPVEKSEIKFILKTKNKNIKGDLQ